MNSPPITIISQGIFDKNKKWLPEGTHNFHIKISNNMVRGTINNDKKNLYEFSLLDFAKMLSMSESKLNLDQIQDCPICLEKLTNETIKLNCKHIFHKNCLKKWLEKKSTCPVCRVKISKNKYFRNIKLVSIERLRLPPSNNFSNEYRKHFASRPNFLI